MQEFKKEGLTVRTLQFVLVLLLRISSWLYLMVRIYLAEQNRSHNAKRLPIFESTQQDDPGKQSLHSNIACVVGHREDPDLFERCLRSYVDIGYGCLVVGIDGNDHQDKRMLQVFEKVASATLYG